MARPLKRSRSASQMASEGPEGRATKRKRGDDQIATPPKTSKTDSHRNKSYRALLHFFDAHSTSFVNASRDERLQALNDLAVREDLFKSKTTPESDRHDGKSLLVWTNDLMKNANGGDKTRARLFREGSQAFLPEYLAKIGFIPAGSGTAETIQAGHRTALPAPSNVELGDDRTGTQQRSQGEHSTGASTEGSNIEVLSKKSQRHSIQTSTRPRVGGPTVADSDASTLRSSITPNAANHFKVHKQEASLVQDSARNTPFELPPSQPLPFNLPASSLIDATQDGEALLDSGQHRITSSEIEGAMKEIFTLLRSSVDTACKALKLDNNLTASFDLNPDKQLRDLYSTVFSGGESWKTTAGNLRRQGLPTAFDALLALLGAAIHRWILRKVQPWQGSRHVSFASEWHRQNFEDVLRERFDVDLDDFVQTVEHEGVRKPEYAREAGITAEARRMAEDMDLVLGPHLRILCDAAGAGRNVHAFGAAWRSQLVESLSQALLLKAKMETTQTTFSSPWYAYGERFERGKARSRYPASVDDVVHVTLFPGIQEHRVGQTQPVVMSKAEVITGRIGPAKLSK